MDIQPQHLSFDNLISKRLFEIPAYQRAYSWGKKQRSDLFNDIDAVIKPGNTHFMATLVGLRREKRTIFTDEFTITDIVDGQQRITTLVILLKAIQKQLCTQPAHERIAKEVEELLVKPDKTSVIILRVNHDRDELFNTYLRHGIIPEQSITKTIADKELREAMIECEGFVTKYGEDLAELLTAI